MNRRALASDILLGIVPIGLVIGLWQGLDSFGYAPVSLLPPGPVASCSVMVELSLVTM